MNLGITLKSAEKVFGPALPGKGSAESTLSAVPFAAGKGKKFVGIPGVHEGAKFYIHFPIAIDWTLAESKKGIPDFVNDLHESGPPGEQGREALVSAFLEKHASLKAKSKLKQEAANTKMLASKMKGEVSALRERLLPFVGSRNAMLPLGLKRCLCRLRSRLIKQGNSKLPQPFDSARSAGIAG
jgi:hypothetical protein